VAPGEPQAILAHEPVRRKRVSFPFTGFRFFPAASDKYRPEIDGLRALAVLAVVFFHARIPGFSGGFVGVDIFYVISGYLITSIIAADLDAGRFSFTGFYERRLRRIFPALYAVVFFTTLAAWVLFTPKDLFLFGKSLIAVTFFVSNLFFKRQAGADGYFGRESDTQPLLHTWSLSVEEQFYLLFPVTLMLLVYWARGRKKEYLWLAVAGSFAINVWATIYRPHSAFYILVPRAWELLIGSLLAMNAVPALKGRLAREIAGLGGLGLIVWAVCVFSRDTTFPGFYALFPCVGAWLIIYGTESGPSFLRGVLSLTPLVFVGVISYSLYLWHWPILVISNYFSAGPLTGAERAAAISLSLVMAVLAFVFVESPFRGTHSRITRRQVFSFAFGAVILSAALGLSIWRYQGLPGRYDDVTRRLVSQNTDRKDDFQEVCANWRKDFNSLADINFCNLGSDSSRKIMFWGDSHVQQLYPVVKKIWESGGLGPRGAVFAVANGCPPTEHLNVSGLHCDAFARFAMIRAERDDIDSVFMAFNTWWSVHDLVCPSVEGRCVGTISLEETRRRFLDELSEHIHRLRERGKRVIVTLPFPFFDKSIPDLQIRNAVFGRFGLEGAATEMTLPSFRGQVASVAAAAGADIFDPRKSLCPDQHCITEVDGVSIYKDDNHIAASQTGILQSDLARSLRADSLASKE
jgi:peptidoglycan/LPS O-acetylase OafA/YrhL